MTTFRYAARWLAIALALVFVAMTGTARAQTAFSNEQLAQMLAPIALYPDSLLSQVLMAATYPADVAEAAAWVKANPNQNGDAAVKAVADKPWDPSVQSLVAFPQVLLQMGDNPKWVQDVGDAFLDEPERVMGQIQVLRQRAYDAGNLKTTEQQKVIVQPAAPAPAAAAPVTNVTQQTIIIEPAQPQVVFVPTYNPTVVFGTWMYPTFPPVYFPPPPGYAFGSALLSGIAFGTGIAITNALWGGFNWGRNDVNINVNRFNNINVNRPINVNQNNVAWRHDAANRRDVPYRGAQSRQRFDSQRLSANNTRAATGGRAQDVNRDQFRGRDQQRDASRERAQAAMRDRGIDPSQGREQLRSDPQARQRAQAAAQNVDRSRAAQAAQNVDRDRARQAAQNVNRDQVRTAAQNADRERARAAAQNVDRDRARQAMQDRGPRDNAFAGANNPGQTRQAIDRGNASRQAMQRPARADGGGMARPSSPSMARPNPPALGGGGGGGMRPAQGGGGLPRGGGGGAGGGLRNR